jgi:hypothetical protein
VFVLRHNGDPFGGKDGGGADISNEVGSSRSKQKAQFFKSYQLHYFQPINNIRDLPNEGFGSVVVEYALLIDILSASFIVYQSNCIIENRFNPFKLTQILPE